MRFSVAALAVATPAAGAGSFASFFLEPNFQGVSFGVSATSCANFTANYQNKIKSMAINDHYQCRLYSQLGCKGNAPYFYYGDFKTFDGSQAKSVKCGPGEPPSDQGLKAVSGF